MHAVLNLKHRFRKTLTEQLSLKPIESSNLRNVIIAQSQYKALYYYFKGKKWRKHRKVITPAFHFQILEEFIDVFNSQSEIMLSKLDKESTKGSFDIYPFVALCTLDIICGKTSETCLRIWKRCYGILILETAMGTSVNAQNNSDSEYVKCVNTLAEITIKRTFSPILRNDSLYVFSGTYREEMRALKVVHGYTRSVIATRKKEFFNNEELRQETTDSFGRKKKKAFLDVLLDYSVKDPEFSEEDIRQEVDTFMFEVLIQCMGTKHCYYHDLHYNRATILRQHQLHLLSML